MATRFVPVTNPEAVFALWEAGILYLGADRRLPTPIAPIDKQWYIKCWTDNPSILGQHYGYIEED